MFIGVHLMLAKLTDTEELAITDDEGKAFMDRAQKVASHYSVTTTQKTMDWIAFGGCAAAIYGPRAIVLVRKQRNKPTRAANAPAPFYVVPPATATAFSDPDVTTT
jgi:hypothetical protein